MVDMKEILDRHGRSPEVLLRVLMDLQEESGTNSLSQELIQEVAGEMGLAESKVYETASFYSMFHLGEKKGKFVIEVCKSAPCHVCGCQQVISLLQTELGVKVGGTTPDGRFTLNTSSCFGGCDMGPAIKIGEKVYGNVNSLSLKEILRTYREVE